MAKIYLTAWGIFLCSVLWAQNNRWSNLRHRIYAPPIADTLWVDSLSLIPASLQIKTTQGIIDTTCYYTQDNKIIWRKPQQDTLQVSYRVFPLAFTRPLSRIDTTLIRRVDEGLIAFDYTPTPSATAGLLDLKGIDYNGSFARGISFGNNQNLTLNSSFNLQMAGNLDNDIAIVAAISDNNIPLQPEGNTKQLQEFDKVFIQIQRKNTTLIAGDYEITRPKHSYFLNYYKRLQGATLSHTQLVGKKDTLAMQGSVAISRGKFARQVLQGQEGSQGPYRLEGAQGERFIIIIAGTEKVFWDGRLLTRGFDQDYIIDYNSGELVFTTRRLVTKDIRIIIEFEYADQNYVRSLYAANTTYQAKRWRAYANIYNEQDSKTSGFAQELSDEAKEALRQAGDSLTMAFASGIDTVSGAYDPDIIQYALRDTVVEGRSYAKILVYSTQPEFAKYTARFTEVGQGRGNYVRLPAITNGRVYAWVAPDAQGTPQGNFEPIIRLVAPKRLHISTIGAQYQLGKNATLQAEAAMSVNNRNRFSDVHKEDDVGGAGFLKYTQSWRLDSLWSLKAEGAMEVAQAVFNPISPYRAAEFVRDWNVNVPTRFTETFLNTGLTLQHQQRGQLRYEFGTLQRSAQYTGQRHSVALRWQKKGWQLIGNQQYLVSEGDVERTRFSRPNIDLSYQLPLSRKRLKGLKIGGYFEQEKNQRFGIQTDTLLGNSFWYWLQKYYIERTTESRFSWHVDYLQRQDYLPFQQQLTHSTRAEEVNATTQWQTPRFGTLSANFTYRQLHILQPEIVALQPQKSYLGRLDYNFQAWKNTVRLSTLYEIGAGREPKIEYNYLQVNAGQGIYTWIDRNLDSIPQLNEFEVAAFKDQANYVRVAVVTTEYINTNNVQWSQSLAIDPRNLWQTSKKRWHKIVRKFSNQTSVKITKRVKAGDAAAWNPIALNLPDSVLVSVVSAIRSVWYFNRAHSVYELQAGWGDTRQRNVLVTGYEARRQHEQFLQGRCNISPKQTLQLNLAQGLQWNDSEAFANQDYQLHYQRYQPEWLWQASPSFRTNLTYKYKTSQNRIGEKEKATIHDLKLELTYNKATASAIRTSVGWVEIAYTGARNTAIEYTMLEGLQKGRNYLWTLSFDKTLSKYLLLSLSYEGRKTGEARTVHIGRAQVRANF